MHLLKVMLFFPLQKQYIAATYALVMFVFLSCALIFNFLCVLCCGVQVEGGLLEVYMMHAG
jgi:hypothetical protein